MNIFILFYWWDIYIIFNMCCQSKKKPVATTAVNQPGPVGVNNGVQPLFPATVGYPATTTYPATNYQYTNSVLSSGVGQSRIPKSTISFSAQDYDSTPLNNQAAFVATKKVTHIVHDRGDRMEDYATEVNTAEKSKMILDNKILNYDLDAENGVSRTPVINTFHYESVLSHAFLRSNVQGSHLSNGPTTSAYYNQVNTSRLDNRQSSHINSQVNSSNLVNKNPNGNPYSNDSQFLLNDGRTSNHV